MLIGIIADTHDNIPLLRKAVDYFNQAGVGLVFHAGDIISPFCSYELRKLRCKMVAVFGNNDGDKTAWKQVVTGWAEIYEDHCEKTIENHAVLMMHDPRELDSLAASQRYDVIIYGHTHKPDCRYAGKTLIINPGECGAWLTGKSSVAILQLPEEKVQFVDLI